MSAWHTVACLVQLRAEVDDLAPYRAHGADGTIGDANHSPGSDHTPDEDSPVLRGRDTDHTNEVHALDLDSALHLVNMSMGAIVSYIVARCRSGAERRLRYIIYNGLIWEASNDWRARKYDGSPDPHINHAHFSASYDTEREADTSPWLEGFPVKIDNVDEVAAAVAAAVVKAMARRDVDPTAGTYSGDGLEWTDHVRLGAVLEKLDAIAVKVSALETKTTTTL